MKGGLNKKVLLTKLWPSNNNTTKKVNLVRAQLYNQEYISKDKVMLSAKEVNDT